MGDRKSRDGPARPPPDPVPHELWARPIDARATAWPPNPYPRESARWKIYEMLSASTAESTRAEPTVAPQDRIVPRSTQARKTGLGASRRTATRAVSGRGTQAPAAMTEEKLEQDLITLRRQDPRAVVGVLRKGLQLEKDPEVILRQFDSAMQRRRKAREKQAREEYWRALEAHEKQVVIGPLADGKVYSGKAPDWETADRRARLRRTFENIRSGPIATGFFLATGRPSASDSGASMDALVLGVVGPPRVTAERTQSTRAQSGYLAPPPARPSPLPLPWLKPLGGTPTGSRRSPRATENRAIGHPVKSPPRRWGSGRELEAVLQRRFNLESSRERRRVPSWAQEGSPAGNARRRAASGERILKRLRDRKVDVADGYTIRKINEIYAVYANAIREHDVSGGTRIVGRGGPSKRTILSQMAELRVLLREGSKPYVNAVRFVKPTNKKGQRRPDIEVTYLDGSRKFVEVKAMTGVARDARLFDRQRTKRPPLVLDHELSERIHRGQITARHPGTIVLYAFQERVTQTALEGWQDLVLRLNRKRPFPAGLEAIEVATPGGLMRFEAPTWKGRVVVPNSTR